MAHLTFDADASDSSGNSYDGTLGDNAAVDTTPATNQVGPGKLTLDGTNDYVNLDSHASSLASIVEGTISAWINFTSTADGTIFNLGDGLSNSDYAWLHVDGGKIR